MEERGSEGGQEEFVKMPINIKIATYNILNTKDRYHEREELLKKNLYELNADIIGLQEVVFGSKQLSELITPTQKSENLQMHQNRHNIDLESLGASSRIEGYTPYESAVQLPIFVHLRNPDPMAALDGNAILIDKLAEQKFGKLVDTDVLHLSPYRNIQRLEFILNNGRRIHICNTHLHHPIPEDHIRLHQIEGAVAWMNDKVKSADDIVFLMGDFNAEPHSLTYKHIIDSGFQSSYVTMHGEEPAITFPTGLQAPFMDTDPAITVDFIFYRIGKGHHVDSSSHIKVHSSKRMGDKKDENDPTIFGSDHFPIVTEFEIYPPRV